MKQSDTPLVKTYAYSYVRFSSAEQMTGDSVRRQLSLAIAYATEFSLILDDKLTYKDFGISSFRGQNAAAGQLGEFLAAVSAGIVPQGSLLLVENLDRLSRESALNAQNLLTQIVLAGVTIVTLSDRRVYSIDELRRDPMGLIYSLINFIRANEESELKSFRGRASWSAKRAIAKDGPITSSCPQWLRLDKSTNGFRVIHLKADLVKNIFELARAGVSNTEIAKSINKRGIPAWKSGTLWTRDKVGWIVRSSAVVGTFVPHYIEWRNGRQVRVPCKPIANYYPRIISDKVFSEVSNKRLTNSWAGYGAIGYILNQLAVCDKCGSLLNMSPTSANGPSLICSASAAGTASHYIPITYATIESTLRRGLPAILRAYDFTAAGYGRSQRLLAAQDNVDRARRKLLALDIEDTPQSLYTGGRENLDLCEERLCQMVDSYQHRATNKIENQASMAIEHLLSDCFSKDACKTINKVMRSIFVKVTVNSTTGDLHILKKDGQDIRLMANGHDHTPEAA